MLQKGDVIALGGKIESLTDKMGLIGPEVADKKALNIALDQAEILVTNKEVVDRELVSFRESPFAGQLQVVNYERGGVPFPVGLEDQAAADGHPHRCRPQGRGRRSRKNVRPHRAPEHGHRPADAVGRHDPRLADRR